MAVDAQVTVVGLNELIVRLTNAEKGMGDRVSAAVTYETNVLEQQVKENMSRLFSNPRRMQESVKGEVAYSGGTVTGTVTASGLPYLRIQEYGGKTRPHSIFPRSGKALAFLWPGRLPFKGSATTPLAIFAKVKHPGSDIPERSFMRASLAQRKAAIINSIKLAAGAF